MEKSGDEKHWLEQANEVRAAANAMHDQVLKRVMLIIAAGYERLAR